MGLGDALGRPPDDQGPADPGEHGPFRGGDEHRPRPDPLARPRRRARGGPLCHDGPDGDGLEPGPRRPDRDRPLSLLPDDPRPDSRPCRGLPPGDPRDGDPGPAARRRQRRGLLRRAGLPRVDPTSLCRWPSLAPPAAAGCPPAGPRLAGPADAHRGRPAVSPGPGDARRPGRHRLRRNRRRGSRGDRRRGVGDEPRLRGGLPYHQRGGPDSARRRPRMVGRTSSGSSQSSPGSRRPSR